MVLCISCLFREVDQFPIGSAFRDAVRSEQDLNIQIERLYTFQKFFGIDFPYFGGQPQLNVPARS